MALHQYIGARYVPKFYENPNNTSEWLPNVIYEPLTIVTYGLNSYTSKKTVPASVGDPSNNPDYWVATGNFNAYIQELDDRVNVLEDTVADLDKRYFLLVADSYYNILNYAMNYLGLTENINYTTCYQSGVGFIHESDNKTIASMIDDATTPDDSKVTDVIIIGGINDSYYNESTSNLYTALGTVKTNIITNFPNVKNIIVYPCQRDLTDFDHLYSYISNYIPALEYACRENGITFINNAPFIYTSYGEFAGNIDALHPTNAGQYMAGRTLVNIIKGCQNTTNKMFRQNVTMRTGFTGNCVIDSTFSDSIVTHKIYMGTVTMSYLVSDIMGVDINIADLVNTPALCAGEQLETTYAVTVTVDNSQYVMPAKIKLKGGHIVFYIPNTLNLASSGAITSIYFGDPIISGCSAYSL